MNVTYLLPLTMYPFTRGYQLKKLIVSKQSIINHDKKIMICMRKMGFLSTHNSFFLLSCRYNVVKKAQWNESITLAPRHCACLCLFYVEEGSAEKESLLLA